MSEVRVRVRPGCVHHKRGGPANRLIRYEAGAELDVSDQSARVFASRLEVVAAKATDPEPEGAGEGVLATDAAVALAAEHRLDLSLIEGSGKDGKITLGDVRAVV